MKIIFGEHRAGRYQNRLFGLLLLVAAVPLLIASLISYYIYVDEITKQNDLAMASVGIQVQKDVEGILTNMKEYYLEAASGEEIAWLSTTAGIPYSQYTDLDAAQSVLRGPSYLNRYIRGYAFVNVTQDWILTNNGMFPVSRVKNAEQTETFLKETAENPSTMFWQNNIDIPSPFERGLYESSTLDMSGFQLVMKLGGGSRILLVQLNRNAVEQSVRDMDGEYAVCILGKTGTPLYASDEELAAYCRDRLDENEELLAEPVRVQLADGRQYRIQATASAANGMYYVIGYDLNEVRQGGSRIITAALVIIGVMLLLLAACRAAAAVLYRPVKNLTDYMADVVKETEQLQSSSGLDEFTSIQKSMGRLVNSREDLQQMVRRQQKLLREQFLTRVIRGEMTAEEISNGSEQFRLKKAKEYRLLAAVCMMEDDTDKDSLLENEALNLQITERMGQDITECLIAPAFSYNAYILLIIGAENDGGLAEKTNDVWERFNAYVAKEFGYTVLAGVSQVFPGLKYLRVAYNECSEMLRNTVNADRRSNSLTFYEKIGRDDGIISGYDFVIENALIKAVDNGDSEEAVQLIDKFVNSLNNRGINGYNRSYCLYRTVVSVLSVLSDAGLNVNQVFGKENLSEDIFRKLGDVYEPDRLKEYLIRQIVIPSIEALKEYRFSSSPDILRSIMGLVKESGGDITLTECAEKLNYHPSYIWKVLKAERNMTFTDLVNKEKLERAKHMLLHTEYSVAEIAEKLNYSNTQNFIRFFGKYVQTTPKKYREEHQSNQRER